MSAVNMNDVDDLFNDAANNEVTPTEFERRISKMIEDAGVESYEEGWQEGFTVGYDEGFIERDYDGD